MEVKRRDSITMKITWKIALLVAFCCAALGIAAIVQSQKIILAQTHESLIQNASEGGKYVNMVVKFRIQILEQVAANPDVVNMDLQAARDDLLEDIDELGYLDLILVDTSGKGQYIKGEESADFSNESYFKNALNGTSNLSDMIIDDSGNPILMYAIPIKKNDKITGVLIGKRDGNALYDAVKSLGCGASGYAYIIDSTGIIIAHKNADYVSGKFNPIDEAKNDSSYESLASSFQEILKNKSGLSEYQKDGNTMYNAYTPIDGTDWTLVCTAVKAEVGARANTLMVVITVLTIVVIAIAIVFSCILGIRIALPVKSVTGKIEQLSDLDFRNTEKPAHKKRPDEIDLMKQEIFEMSEKVGELIREVSDSAGQVSATSQELSATAQQSAAASEEVAQAIGLIAQGAENQMTNTLDSQKSLENLSNEIESNETTVNDLDQVSQHMSSAVVSGKDAVEDLVEKNHVSRLAVDHVYDSVAKTRESTVKIEEAASMIANVAKQTNLLSLNASIEAARAGEHGKGFAIVADEIRVLSEQVATMTSIIDETVKDLLKNSNETTGKVEEAREISKQQEDVVTHTKEAFLKIENSIDESLEYVKTISISGQSMSREKQIVNTNIEDLYKMAEENAAASEQSAAAVQEQSASVEEVSRASEALAKMALELQEMVKQFKV